MFRVELTTSHPAEQARTVPQTRPDFDPCLRSTEMRFGALFYPLGFPLQLRTNSEEVVQAAVECWGKFEQQFDNPPLQVRIGVLESESTACPPTPVCRANGSLMARIADSGNFHIADLVQGHSFAWLTSAATLHPTYLRYHFIEASALTHIANRDAAPIHAACVELDGHGVLLCGDSGAGKSSLAFACARGGWTYISDDASFLLHGRTDRRVVGNSHLFRLRPSAAELFEEVEDYPLTARAAGKPSIELWSAQFPTIVTAPSSHVDFIVFLNRGTGSLHELVRSSKERAENYLTHHLTGIAELRVAQTEAMERLLGVPVLELRYRDLDWAMGRLERLVREG